MATKEMAGLQLLLKRLPNWPTLCGSGSLPILYAIQRCRTAALGYHMYRCPDKECSSALTQYHSCRNRHCPHCGNSKKEDWIESRMRELFPCKYYHMVFTLPHELNGIIMGNRKELFDLLFDASSYTLKKFAKDEQHMGATPGIISVLHTWGQQLSFHPHVHCIVSGGGIDPESNWRVAKKVKYGRLFPVKAMAIVYKARFMALLKEKILAKQIKLSTEQAIDWPKLQDSLYAKRWIVHAKQPFGGPAQVVEYLGRYTHKVAISNHRILKVDENGRVSFTYKDYADHNKTKQMELSGEEFLRRFEQHILPQRFCKIRSYGLYANHRRKTRVEGIQQKMELPRHPDPVILPWEIKVLIRHGVDPLLCPACKCRKMELLAIKYPG